jgi:SAM-dependent methyltransferase
LSNTDGSPHRCAINLIGVDDSERLTHADSFGNAAAAYAEHRPDYAAAAVRWALERAPGNRVLDLAAGTGKLTRILAGLGSDVIAVEPDEAMLAQLRENVPAVRAFCGRAEAIPLPDGSVDAVLAGQALHWFDMAVAGPEIARVLAPGGVLWALWNLDDDRTAWVRELEEAAEYTGGATLTQWRSGDHEAHLAEVSLPGLFGCVERAEFTHGQTRTADSLVATIGTHSRLLVMDASERARVLAKVRAFLNRRPETADGEFTFPIVTAAVRAVLGNVRR